MMSLDTTFSLQALFSVVASSQLAYLYPHKVKQIIPASCSSGTFIVEPVTPRSYHTEMAGHQDRKRNVLFYHIFFPHIFLHCLTVTLFLVLCFFLFIFLSYSSSLTAFCSCAHQMFKPKTWCVKSQGKVNVEGHLFNVGPTMLVVPVCHR